uniref:Flavodoxin-like fold domain-containing protein n=1 Tax=Scophthalmus maximus TaxID=52904 RepID=A0A8D3D3L3_SCOMX
MAAKKVLLVYAHQSSGSFNAAAKDAAVKALKAQGCTVEVSDLYAMKFKASATAEDITGEVQNAEHFRYAEETKLAWKAGKLAADIVEEQRKVTEADLIIFQDKKAMLSFTTGSQESMFSANGINGDMNVTLWPLQNGILNYCGFQVLAPQIFWAPSHITTAARKTMLEAWCPLTFTPSDCFDGEKGFQLKPEFHEKHANKESGPPGRNSLPSLPLNSCFEEEACSDSPGQTPPTLQPDQSWTWVMNAALLALPAIKPSNFLLIIVEVLTFVFG